MSKTLISILAGLGGMFGWGTSDFFANSAADKVGHVKTLFWSQIAGLCLIILVALFTISSISISPYLLLLTVISGIAYALGYLLFYHAFEIGNVSVVSAVINSQNLFIIFIAYFLFGQRITQLQILALPIILLGIILVSVNFKDFKKTGFSLLLGVKETLLSAVMFGIFFWPVNEYIVERTAWLPVNLITKLVAIVTVGTIALIKNQKLAINKTSHKLKFVLILVGLLEAAGILSVSFGLSVGDSIIIAPIASALTLVTVALAMIFLKEKISKFQAFGIMMTIVGIVLMGV